MPKLIIPNAYEIYQSEVKTLTNDEINARYFYNLRFLWLLESGDAIILPKPPSKGFLAYLAKIKNIDPDALHLVILSDKYTSLNSSALSDSQLIEDLRRIITSPEKWTIQTCYFNQAVLTLAEQLHLPIHPEWKMLIASDFIKKSNSKAKFRDIAINNNIPIPEGKVCSSLYDFTQSINYFIKYTGQVIIKQEYNASGKGNIGISNIEGVNFVGVMKSFIVNSNEDINTVSHQLWSTNADSKNEIFVVEAYYPNQGSFTAQFWVSKRGEEPTLVNYSEILMESRWVGVQIPPSVLSPSQSKLLVSYSKRLAEIIQLSGYQGYLCCDAILTHDNRLLFTEINVRPGAETHAYVLAKHLFGESHQNQSTIITRNGMKTKSFDDTFEKLRNENILLTNEKSTGVVLLTVDDTYSQEFEYLVVAKDVHSANNDILTPDEIREHFIRAPLLY